MREQPPATDGELRAALAEANLPTLLLALAQLTGDDRWLREPYVPTAPRGAEDHDSGGLPEHVQTEVREQAFAIVDDWRAGRLDPAAPPTSDRLPGWLSLSLGSDQVIPAEIGGLLAEELGIAPRDITPLAPGAADDFRVLIIGSGFSGLCAAIKLEQANIPYVVLEKNDDLGGTWLENTYPGCGVDTPSHLYSFSFAQCPDWTRYFAKRDELHDYLERLADGYDVRANIRFGLEVASATWHADEARWHVQAQGSDGKPEEFVANAVISAVGFLNRPSLPDIPGIESFAGSTMHTARWDRDLDLAGRRVAVIGTGASAMQLVPAIVDEADHVTVFQRSPQWGLPNPNAMRDVSPATRTLMREVPFYLGWYRLRNVWNFGDRLHPALQIDPDWPHPDRAVNEVNDRHRRFLTDYIKSELGDREDLIPKCVPTYPPYGKRPLLDNGWFRTMRRADVTLVTDAVAAIEADGVITADGVRHLADVLVIATGFKALEVLGPIEVRGRSGRTLRETWGKDDARAHLGITVPDYPNFFFLLGPNTFAGHGGSAALSIEMEVRYVMRLLEQMLERGISSVECKQAVHEEYGARLDAALNQTIWAHPGMTTYYRNSAGRIVVPMPWTNYDYWHMTREPNLDHFSAETTVGAI
ncbi:4-hydroxyacetophenone monooxygenase [Paraconexibacter sp. AEG42_29]|uniref:4-hydroxyacetophenone monooxygenase n=1 Tax=Paraconexibacter sp. AEG42_29 TaxID=2997339 RepID=A0AAU7B3R0_9ACTN